MEALFDWKAFSSRPTLLLNHLRAAACGPGRFNLGIIMQQKLFAVDALNLHKVY